MAVYVDDMYRFPIGRFGRMKMSHLIADTDAELHDMAVRIGIKRRWYQHDHYDICQAKRAVAIALGAVPVSMKQLAAMSLRKRVTGHCGSPEDALAWVKRYMSARRAARHGMGAA